MTLFPYFDNLAHVVPLALAHAPSGICYKPAVGWSVYRPTDGAPRDTEADFLCLSKHALPIPLNVHAELALVSLVRTAVEASK